MIDIPGEKDSANILDNAINQVLADTSMPHNPDLGGNATTTDVDDAIIAKLNR